MKKIPAIAYLQRARNAEHYNLQEALLKAISAQFASKYKLDPLRNAYQTLFEKEDAIFLQTRAFADTKELSEKDAVRDRYLRLFKATLLSKELGLSEEDAEAAKRVSYAFDPYTDAAARPDAENTAMVSDMVKKLQSDTYAADLAKLGLTEIVAALKKANDEFAESYSRRADEKRIRRMNESLLEIRPQVDEAAAKLFEAINALYLVNEAIEKDVEKSAEIGAVINAVNAQIVQFSETLSRRGAGKKVKVQPDDKPDITDPTPTPPDQGGSDRPEIE